MNWHYLTAASALARRRLGWSGTLLTASRETRSIFRSSQAVDEAWIVEGLKTDELRCNEPEGAKREGYPVSRFLWS